MAIDHRTLDKLFEPATPPRISAYKTTELELSAVASRKKPMAMYSFLKRHIQDSDEAYSWIVERAGQLSLMVVHDPDDDTGSVKIYVVRPEQLWRAQAYASMWNIMVRRRHRWSEDAEALSCHLLGYSEDETKKWFQFHSLARASWGGETIYLLVSNSQLTCIEQCGYACVPAACLQGEHGSAISVFWYRGRAVLNRRASTLIPAGWSIARAAISRQVFDDWFTPAQRPGRPGVLASSLTPHMLSLFNNSLRSRIQIWSGGKWSESISVSAGDLTLPEVIDYSTRQ